MLVKCLNCGVEFDKVLNQIKKTPNHFCGRSCAAKYNNKKYPKRKVEGKCEGCSAPIPTNTRNCAPCWVVTREAAKIKAANYIPKYTYTPIKYVETFESEINWTIEKTVSKGDYTYAVVRDHPHATTNGYVLEHRIVMENHLGRLIARDEVVHHINESKKDNRLENLELTTQSEHTRLHMSHQVKNMVDLRCPTCNCLFTRTRRRTHLSQKSKWTACSPKCRGKFSSKIQYQGVTPESIKAMKDNVIREYVSNTA